ncbi:cytochrome P450 [Sodiomyces alkalinus F11]|uniref:Cytochrome P450 n=1 Tax=Sodiomyces alkalinus (strain CBS 110278 / VKM F-3762 / F11) TaxID=1314773 RepID=A0A3N2Q293_SODAK|nr:cytochrome P450 [Sodiomyces alkalinus F11]ROT40788.1 cytochrome P450 [Sodiomyces alkalinus F11]
MSSLPKIFSGRDTQSYAAIASLAVVSLYGLYLWLLPKPLPGIPYNSKAARRLLGDAPDMMRSVAQTREVMRWFAEQTQKLDAPLCQVFIRPFSKPWVLLADYREAQDVLLRRTREFDRSSFTADLMAPAGYFHIRYKTDRKWKAARRWLQDLMTPGFLHTVAAPAIYEKTLDLVQLWKVKNRLADGRPFAADLDMHCASLDAVMAFTFGDRIRYSAIAPQVDILEHLEKTDVGGVSADRDEPVRFPKADLHEFIVAATEGTVILEKIINSPTPKWTHWWMSLSPWYRNIFAVKDRFIREQVNLAVERFRHLEKNNTDIDEDAATRSAVDHILLRERALAQKQERDPDFSSQQLIDEIFGNIVAGHDTTSSALAWVLKFLTDNPATQTKLRAGLRSAHADAAAAGRVPTLAELIRNKVPYLDAVWEEALRLSAVSVTREATCDTTLLGHHIPKGTVVFLLSNGPSFYGPSLPIDEDKRSPSSRAAVPRRWDERGDVGMQAFHPERWLATDEKGGVEFDATAGPQLVFGLGPRGCFGKRLAYLEARVITTMLIWSFELLPVPEALGGDEATDGVTHRARNCYVRLRSTE